MTSGRGRRAGWAAVAAAWTALGVTRVEALDPDRAITQYVHEFWTVQDGAPAGTITGIAQTPNGYLWLGTLAEGLVRFDGVAFVRETGLDRLFDRRVDRVTSLMCGRDGTLWVGTKFGLARLRAGGWAALDRGELQSVFGLFEAEDGTVWYARPWEGLHRVTGDSVTSFPLTGKPRFVTADIRGVLWAGGYEGLWRVAGESRRLYSPQDGLAELGVTCVHGDRAGNVWVGAPTGLTLLRDDKVVARFGIQDGLSGGEANAVLADRAGSVWIGTASGGLIRRRAERFEALTRARGLTNGRVTALYEDREGSLWVGTAGGLNRLRDANLLPIGEPEGLSPREPLSVVEARDGSVHVSFGFDGVNRIEEGRVHVSPPGDVPGSDFDGPLFADPDGGVWSGRGNGLSYRRAGRTRSYPVPGLVTCVSRDARSIVYARGNGEIFRLVGGRAERYRLADGSPLGPEPFGFDYVWSLHVSKDGTLWLATSRGAIAVRDGRARQVWHKGPFNARSVFEDEEGTIWLGTMAGVVRVAGESVATFTTRQGLAEDDVHTVLSDGRGGLWMGGARGISRVSRQELEAVAQGKARSVAVSRFGVAEGMRTSAAVATRQPAGCVTRDGRLWFATTGGLVVVGPARAKRNDLPPPVVVESVVADGRPLGAGPQVSVAPGSEQVAIHYNGLSLLVPQRVRFKFKLEGLDRDWVDAEGRRAAFYTKLPPGDYRFRVVAANNDGVWNDAGASIAIRQLPLFHQTGWFFWLVALGVAGSTWGAVWIRVRRHERTEKELQDRIREALAEITTLSGMLPICASCKKVRDDTGYWSQIETYVKEHSEAEFTHGICPDCRPKLAVSQ